MVGRLVEQQNVRLWREHARKRGPAGFAAGEADGLFIAAEAELLAKQNECTFIWSNSSGHPLGVAATRAVTSAGAVLEPAEVARDVLAAIDEERFLILPHANVLDMFRQKASDYDRWLRGMRRYQASLLNDSQ